MCKARAMILGGSATAGLLLAAGVVTALGPADRATGERSASKPVTIPRSSIESATWVASGGVVMLADLQDLYEPVPFNHKGHAEMAEMSAGCTVCHHHTPVGQEHPACRSCHEKTAVREDIAMPGLKGAYHRQCMSCHREWSHDTACNACHVAKPPRGATLPWQAGGGEVAPRKPAIRIEGTYVYQTPHLESPVVTFHHEDHSKAFGVACVQCHGGESCSSCHDGTAGRPLARANLDGALAKDKCITCHQETKCNFCHDQAQRPRFDHATNAGWALGSHHSKVACPECHGQASGFTVPSKVCHSCHARPRERNAPTSVAREKAHRSPDDADCLSCHADLKGRLDRAACIHGPASDKSGCVTCHDLSTARSPRPSPDRQRELCLSCHNGPIDAGRGRPLVDMAALLSRNPDYHGPVKEGKCTACHDPHGGEHAHLLVREYAAGFYARFSPQQYALCFGCHEEDRVLNESGTAVTGFRDGDRNLHRLHVNREKGRACLVCHEVHASSRPLHMRESVPFSDSGWMLFINYERTAGGGSCAPGCHAAESYERGRLVRATPSTAPSDSN